MLNTLTFKRSVFVGVLDGGENDVFLGGTRLTKFMESVEKATGTIPTPPSPATSPSQVESPAAAAPPPTSRPVAPPQPAIPVLRPAADAGAKVPAPSLAPLSDLIGLGRQLLDGLGAALAGSGGIASGSEMVERDEKTGRSYLRLPMPSAEILQTLAAVVDMLKIGGKKGE
jgi:hypothetical protein